MSVCALRYQLGDVSQKGIATFFFHRLSAPCVDFRALSGEQYQRSGVRTCAHMRLRTWRFDLSGSFVLHSVFCHSLFEHICAAARAGAKTAGLQNRRVWALPTSRRVVSFGRVPFSRRDGANGAPGGALRRDLPAQCALCLLSGCVDISENLL